jgi:hypothetical protein
MTVPVRAPGDPVACAGRLSGSGYTRSIEAPRYMLLSSGKPTFEADGRLLIMVLPQAGGQAGSGAI